MHRPSAPSVPLSAGRLLALAAAAVFLEHCATPAPALSADAAAQQVIPCYGANRCAGMSQCATTNYGCGMHNDCRGTGWDYLSRAECQRIGGSEEEKR